MGVMPSGVLSERPDGVNHEEGDNDEGRDDEGEESGDLFVHGRDGKNVLVIMVAMYTTMALMTSHMPV